MKRNSGFNIMRRLIVELKPLAPIMGITIFMGVLGFLAAIAIMVFGVIAVNDLLGTTIWVTYKTAIAIMIASAVLRGLLRYVEQLSGHYIAFKILAILRDKVFGVLRKLSPAKLESKEKGNLITLITSDIELLEVFYAHTIAPIIIAVITSSIIAAVLWKMNIYFGLLSILFYFIIGFAIPYFSSKIGNEAGIEYRNTFGETNTHLLDSLRGLKEIVLYGNGKERLHKINQNSNKLNEKLKIIKLHEGIIRACTDFVIMIAILTFVLLGFYLYEHGIISFGKYVVCIIIISSSFGPVVALSNLANTLLHTFACAQRIFDILDEAPVVEEIEGEATLKEYNINYEKVSFSYPERDEEVLKGINLNINKGEKVAIIGESGSGKSTLIKLLMRFWNPENGKIDIGGKNIDSIPTKTLRETQTLVAQDTFLFNEAIEENIRVGNLNATREQVVEAAKKASIHDFIESLPNGYDTEVGELGGNISSGEKQRIGLARAFLHNAPILILDEPTSNLDTLNEAKILKVIKEQCKEQTVILISHRKSTTSVCDQTLIMKDKQLLA